MTITSVVDNAEAARALYAAKFDDRVQQILDRIHEAASAGQHGILIDGYGFDQVSTSMTVKGMPEEPGAIMGILASRGYDVMVRADKGGRSQLAIMWGFMRPAAGSAFLPVEEVADE